ncbi:helix-turn-helix transcriptional regulator [Acidiphilium sp. JA12-A1]|uniref:ArsR/SmtB family transcription factor n=1 Tax=Acidiphilium sp. JA12-A1 TaxID=1464546 RepID=UPI000460B4D8|nr:helix-turn-helix transcriptional regulator [Acidiphilium sp. JA12-A1]KDM68773.1 transcriptional regulator, ArsR family protein [Acidiphilium sp. JA12-A1]
MLSTASFAETAALAGDPARANMLAALMDGRALTATELARVAGITPQTASGHLARLTGAGFLAMERQGKHRYYRLASPAIANMLEGIMAVAGDLNGGDGPRKKKAVVVGPRDKALRRIRTCYDHLAGQVAVAMADRMVERGFLDISGDGGALTDEGVIHLRGIGVDLDSAAMRSSRRGGPIFCRPCLDWSERRSHIAGSVGAAICHACFSQDWMRRIKGTRAVAITPSGHLALSKAFGADIPG